jgi:hypothetical protein
MPDQAVKEIQEKLIQLGFTLLGKADGVAGARTLLTLRDFQCYARMDRVARVRANAPAGRWVERLEPVTNALPPAKRPPINGDLADDLTLKAIQFWVDGRYRCPVVVEVREFVDANQEPRFEPGLENVWTYDDPKIAAYRTLIRAGKDPGGGKARDPSFDFRVCDFTKAAAPPPTAWLNMPSIGVRDYYLGYWGGAGKKREHLHDDMEVTPLSATGKSYAQLEWQKPVFQAIRAVAEQECLGFFDALNGYDNAFMSLGPCHWTVAIGPDSPPKRMSREAAAGELPAVLAFAIGREAAIQDRYLSPFGVKPAGAWLANGKGTEFNISFESTRNYGGFMKWQNPADADIKRVADLSWFRTTHWYRRFLELARGSEAFRHAQWDMARMRLRDVLATPLGGTGPYKSFRLGDLFTSQLAAALLLRLHVRYAAVTRPGNKKWVGHAIALAEVTGQPASWSHPEEKRLIEGLIAHAVRISYSLQQLKLDKLGRQPKRAELLAALPGVPEKERKVLPGGMQAVAAWPDPKVFKKHDYKLEAPAWQDDQGRPALLNIKRHSFDDAFARLASDTSLPKPVV